MSETCSRCGDEALTVFGEEGLCHNCLDDDDIAAGMRCPCGGKRDENGVCLWCELDQDEDDR